MKLTQARASRYLQKVKKINDYLVKLQTKNRNHQYLISQARAKLFEAEESLRELHEGTAGVRKAHE